MMVKQAVTGTVGLEVRRERSDTGKRKALKRRK